MNLVTELKKEASKNALSTIDESEEFLNMATEELEKATGDDMRMFSMFGISDRVSIVRVNKEEAKIALSSSRLAYDQIKKICLRYNLRFLNIAKYIAPIPYRVLTDMKNFEGELNKTRRDWMTQFEPSRLFIIAPTSHFALSKRPPKDPVLLYLINDHSKVEERMYEIVSTWGSDFTWKRRFSTIMGHWSVSLLAFVLPAIWLINKIVAVTHKGEDHGGLGAAWFFGGFAILVGFQIYQFCRIAGSDWDTPFIK